MKENVVGRKLDLEIDRKIPSEKILLKDVEELETKFDNKIPIYYHKTSFLKSNDLLNFMHKILILCIYSK